jgi:hypothetical protein
MAIPKFTAENSLYRSAKQYRTSYRSGSLTGAYEVVPQAGKRFEGCDDCEINCATQNVKCQATASAVYAVAAAACGGFVLPPAIAVCEGIAAGAYIFAIGLCYAWNVECEAECWYPGKSACCPVFCELGHCCSSGETCIPHGCCPNDQAICGGECCDPGWTCCGDNCCPPNYYCLDDGFCSPYPSGVPFGNPPPPEKPPTPTKIRCRAPAKPCGDRICCPPELQCCDIGGGQVACMDNCLH